LTSSGNKSAPRRIYHLTLAYKGTPFLGWQRQPNGPTVQEHLETALARFWKRPVIVHGSGRTDTGVHAHAQTAHFTEEPRFPPATLQAGLNHSLPPEIRITACRLAPANFHARFSAIGKEYEYWIENAPVASPFHLDLRWHLPRPLNLPALTEALKLFEGTHDFASFTSNPGYERTNTIRTIHRAQIQKSGPLIRIRVTGNGFLFRMVRNLVGATVKVGHGRLTLEELSQILAARKRSGAPPSAPAHGLYLHRVYYDESTLQRRLNRA
jgi:tRNA pseudouridine38-40 synthase